MTATFRKTRIHWALTLTELTVFIGVCVIVVAIVVPTVRAQRRLERIVHARSEVRQIAESLQPRQVRLVANRTTEGPEYLFDRAMVLVGEGPVPSAGSDPRTRSWHHETASPLRAYLPTTENGQKSSIPSIDPWGNAYLVNVGHLLAPGHPLNGEVPAVYVLSAGPDGRIDTPFDQAASIAAAAGDDIVCRMQ